MFAKYFTAYFLKTGKIHFLVKMWIFLLSFRRNVMVFFRGKFQNFENLEWMPEYNIDKNAFNASRRKPGISLFARLKNGEDFLEKAIESHLPYVDEIVLVDNNSTDRTVEICKNFAKKFGEKIKFFEYLPDVVAVWNEKWWKIPENSVHSLVHYYNWTLSKTNFRYVAKLDDDMIVADDEKFSKKIEEIRKNTPKKLTLFPQINIFSKNKKFLTPLGSWKAILPPIAGIYGDHGIFPISEKTYFVRAKKMESFVFPFGIQFSDAFLFHLKWLKKSQWRGSYEWKILHEIKNFQENTEFVELDDEKAKFLKDKNIFPK